MTVSQVKAYDHGRAVKHLHERTLPPRALRLPEQLLDSQVAYADRTTRVRFTNRLAAGQVIVDVDVGAHRGAPPMRGQLVLDTRGAAQVVNLPFAHGSIYSHKVMGPVTGELVIGDDRHALDGGAGVLDDHKGYYPYVMHNDWVTSLWRGDDGLVRGFNLTRNQCLNPARWNENCV